MTVLVILGCLLAVESAGHVISGSISVPVKKYNIHESILPKFSAETRVTAVKQGSIIGSATVTTEGQFSIVGVPEGKYVIYTSHAFMQFDPVTVTISSDGNVRAQVYDALKNSSSPLPELGYPLKLVPSRIESPYLQEEEFNAFQIFKNPMVIMGLVMLGLVWLMPKMQGGMSPEEMSNMRKELEQEGGIAANLLKSMIPSSSSSGGGGPVVGGSIPSLTSNKKME